MRVVVLGVVGDVELLRANLQPDCTALYSHAQDRASAAAATLAAELSLPFAELPALTTAQGLVCLWQHADAVVVITDGRSYLCAEIVRRARARGVEVCAVTRPWKQLALLGDDG